MWSRTTAILMNDPMIFFDLCVNLRAIAPLFSRIWQYPPEPREPRSQRGREASLPRTRALRTTLLGQPLRVPFAPTPLPVLAAVGAARGSPASPRAPTSSQEPA